MTKNGKGKGIDPSELIDDVNPSPMVRKLRKDNSALQKRVDELKLEMGENEAYFEELRRVLESVSPKELPVYEPPKEKKSIGSPIAAVLMLSDWHIGEVTDADETEEFGQFSWELAQKRVEYLVQKFINWVNVQRANASINEAVVIVTGDLVSGDIHQELQVTNEFPVPVQIVNSGFLLAKAIGELAPHFEKVRVEYVSADNHSRLTRKPQYKQAGYNSYGYTVAWLAQERLSKIAAVEFNVYSKIKSLITISGFRYLCMHGHVISGWAGFPWYGADRQVAREAKARRSMPTKTFEKVIMGHFHTPLKTLDYLINGSLSGTNELDHGQGRHCNPCQVAFLIHPKYGDFNWTEFFLHWGDEEDFGGAELVFEA